MSLEDFVQLKNKYTHLLQGNSELSHDLDILELKCSALAKSFSNSGETLTHNGFVGKLSANFCPLEEEGGKNDGFIRFITFESNNHLSEYNNFKNKAEVIDFAKSNGWKIFNLYMRQHSGVIYEIDDTGDGCVDDKWHVGFIIVNPSTTKADCYALELCEQINYYCEGKCFLLEIFTPNLELVSTWCFFGGRESALKSLKENLIRLSSQA